MSRSPSSSGFSAWTRVAATAPRAERGPQHRQRQSGVVLDPVVIDDPAGQALAPQVGRVLDRARWPEVLRRTRRRAARRAGRTGRCRCRRSPGGTAGCRRSGTGTAPGSRGAARAGAAARAPRAPRTRARNGAARGSAGRRGSGGTTRPDVPDAMSRCSTSAARSPRLVASRSAPAPTIPPPTIEDVEPLARERLEGVGRAIGGSVGSPDGALGSRDSSRLRRPARRDAATARSPVPMTRTTISRGVWKTTRWASVGSTAVRIAAPSTTPDGDRRDDQDLAPADAARVDQPRSASGRDPDRRDEDLAGQARATCRQQAGLRSMEGHRQVGTDDGLRGVARGQVDRRRRIDRDDRHLRLRAPGG